MKWIFIILALTSSLIASAQDELSVEGIVVIDRYEDMDGYYIFSPQTASDKVVIFFHGYGAINPAVYGGWIKHLVQDKKVHVIYPRYQASILNPATEDFPVTMAAGVKQAVLELQKKNAEPLSYYYAGHSYGGAAVVFWASEYASYDLPKPTAVFAAQPGTGFFKGMVLDTYEGINDDIPVVLAVGENDDIVGDRLARLVYKTMSHDQKRYVTHYEDRSATESVDADHHAPYTVDLDFDNGIYNMTMNRAIETSQYDQEDKQLYHYILDQLLDGKSIHDFIPLGEWQFASWSDGTPVKSATVK